MEKLVLSLALLFISGCTQVKQVLVYEAEPGKYRLSTSGDISEPLPTLHEKIERQAAKLCGKGKYSFQGKGNVEIVETRMYKGIVHEDSVDQILTEVVICETSGVRP